MVAVPVLSVQRGVCCHTSSPDRETRMTKPNCNMNWMVDDGGRCILRWFQLNENHVIAKHTARAPTIACLLPIIFSLFFLAFFRFVDVFVSLMMHFRFGFEHCCCCFPVECYWLHTVSEWIRSDLSIAIFIILGDAFHLTIDVLIRWFASRVAFIRWWGDFASCFFSVFFFCVSSSFVHYVAQFM